MKMIDVNLEPNGARLTGFVYEPEGLVPQFLERPAVLIMAGGGYRIVMATEREPMAMAYMAAGFNAFILHYTVIEKSVGSPQTDEDHVLDRSLEDAVAAMRYLRSHADELHIIPDQIATVGFSAGGNLAARLGIMTQDKPNAMVFGYGAFTTEGPVRGMPTLYDKIGPDTPPSFLFSCRYDTFVPPDRAMRFAMALQENDVPFEVHIFAYGEHGISLATDVTGNVNDEVAAWHGMSVKFLKHIFKKDVLKQKLRMYM